MTTQFFNQKRRALVNGPTAAVLRFDGQEGSAPTVVAQGKGHLAMKIMELARQNDVHMQEDAGLLQNLLDVDLGGNIPPQLYSVIAEVFLLLEEMEKNY
ncbi:EscU/YscU/HrcU family type III secretion system export apparatus switch protein [Bacillus infantis]|jgi:flagellar biosynthesis protein|uniref:EscU/YscU/HrcU family type III secretion system export apparatus switch protein n=1 Tax=Bacillaceae TaxID=186817 RepID=UPI000B9AA86C|nr:EscU/YscU/HrcU family type III secretion system export apparatus switch protein [Bacillus infantis]MDW2876644.1 EscU/YscU/HrcU family type III secretion system export apparatus switch protein [Bacillus infantis]OXT16871.1 flagellar biosynthesis protein FlhS [Bacillus sp. OG2]